MLKGFLDRKGVARIHPKASNNVKESILMRDREAMYSSRDRQSIQSNCVVTDNEREIKCQITQFKFCMFSKIDSHCLRLHGIELLNKQRLISDAMQIRTLQLII